MKWLAGGTSAADFRTLSEGRIGEARLLFVAGELDGAAYLGGYSIECALKAIIAKAVPAAVLLPHRNVQQIFSHNLTELARHAEVFESLTKSAPAGVAISWTLVNTWSEQQRYTVGAEASAVGAFLDSIDDATKGILPWLKQRW